MSNRPLVALVVAVLVALGLPGLTAGPAVAHAELISSDPVAGARLDARPRQLTLRFGEALAARTALARVVVTVDDAETSYDPVAQVQGDRVIVPLEDVTSDGRYAVTYRVASKDGHPVEGTVRFQVVTPVEPDGGASGDEGQGQNGSDPDAETSLSGAPTATTDASPEETPPSTAPATGAESAGTRDTGDDFPPWLLLGGGLAVLVATGAAVVLAARRRASPPAS